MPPSPASPLPDFFIAGAMKSGTSTLHRLLETHPRIFLPEPEIFFFDLDDQHQHPDFPPLAFNTPEHMDWYRGFFAGAGSNQVVGEDSTTYLASPAAPGRMQAMLPNARILIVLRDPVDRAVSHYWHNVTKGRTTCGLSTALETDLLLRDRSIYVPGVQRFLAAYGPQQTRIILFEEFVAHIQPTLDSILTWLGLEDDSPLSTPDLHANAARIPRVPTLKRFLNHGIEPLLRDRYQSHLPGGGRTSVTTLAGHALNRLSNLGATRRVPPVPSRLYQEMSAELRLANEGLEDLLGRSLAAWWPSWNGD